MQERTTWKRLHLRDFCYRKGLVRMIGEMINIACEPLELWKYATDGTNN